MVVAALVLVLLAGCGGAKYTEEKAALSAATSAMETFSSAIQRADSPLMVAQALSAFNTSVENVLPAMKKMTTEHADWGNSPPEALKETYTQFESAKNQFQSAMPKVMEIAGQNADNEALQGAITKFRELASQL